LAFLLLSRVPPPLACPATVQRDRMAYDNAPPHSKEPVNQLQKCNVTPLTLPTRRTAPKPGNREDDSDPSRQRPFRFLNPDERTLVSHTFSTTAT
jgi:hypothetical protein